MNERSNHSDVHCIHSTTTTHTMSFDDVVEAKGWENMLSAETSDVLIADEMEVEEGAWDPSAFAELPDS